MTATVTRLSTAAAKPVLQDSQRDEYLWEMAILIAARAQRRGFATTAEEALAGIRASMAKEIELSR